MLLLLLSHYSDLIRFTSVVFSCLFNDARVLHLYIIIYLYIQETCDTICTLLYGLLVVFVILYGLLLVLSPVEVLVCMCVKSVSLLYESCNAQ